MEQGRPRIEMTKAEEALYHILCARWKVTNAELSQEEVQRLLDQATGLVERLTNWKPALRDVDTAGMVVQ